VRGSGTSDVVLEARTKFVTLALGRSGLGLGLERSDLGPGLGLEGSGLGLASKLQGILSIA
jgi:hypothetical protein